MAQKVIARGKVVGHPHLGYPFSLDTGDGHFVGLAHFFAEYEGQTLVISLEEPAEPLEEKLLREMSPLFA